MNARTVLAAAAGMIAGAGIALGILLPSTPAAAHLAPLPAAHAAPAVHPFTDVYICDGVQCTDTYTNG